MSKLMTAQEFLNSDIFAEYISRITNYHKGFQWTFPYCRMKRETRNACKLVANEAIKRGLIKSVSIGAGWDEDGNWIETEETFERV